MEVAKKGHGGGQEGWRCWPWWQQKRVKGVVAMMVVAMGAVLVTVATAAAAGRIRQSLVQSRPCPEGWCRFTG